MIALCSREMRSVFDWADFIYKDEIMCDWVARVPKRSKWNLLSKRVPLRKHDVLFRSVPASQCCVITFHSSWFIRFFALRTQNLVRVWYCHLLLPQSLHLHLLFISHHTTHYIFIPDDKKLWKKSEISILIKEIKIRVSNHQLQHCRKIVHSTWSITLVNSMIISHGIN